MNRGGLYAFVCIDVEGGTHGFIPIGNIDLYFIHNIFPSGHGGMIPQKKHNYANITAAGHHQEATRDCRYMVIMPPGVGVQDRIGEVKGGRGLRKMLFLLEGQIFIEDCGIVDGYIF